MLPGAAALVLLAAQSAACIEVPRAAAALAEQAESCLETLFADQDTVPRDGRLAAGDRCAPLSSALADSPVPITWREGLRDGATTDQLLDLSALLRSYQKRPPAVPFQPDLARLDTLLAQTLEKPEDSGWWQRFSRWLQDKLDKHRNSQAGQLLERLAGYLPPAWVVEVMVKGAFVLLILLALIVVLNVLRDEGVRLVAKPV